MGLWGLLFLSMLLALGARAAQPAPVAGASAAWSWATRPPWLEQVRRCREGGRRGGPGADPPSDRRDRPPRIAGARLGSLETLGLTLAEHGIHRAIIAPGAADSRDVLHVVRLIKAMGVRVSMLPRLTEVVGSSVEFDDLEGLTMMGLRRYGLSRSSRALKRAMDLVVSVSVLTLLAPLMLTIAVAIKIGSPGPVFFRQRRIGMEGLGFEIFKFRSMFEDAELLRDELDDMNEVDDGLFKIADDPRLTAVGRLLRRSSLDELPQLINVVKGQMSLVGPRPLVPDEDQRVEGLDRRRLHVMPGVTGIWQIYGSSRIPMREMVTIDYLYGANWSLWLDIKTLLRTVPFVLRARGL